MKRIPILILLSSLLALPVVVAQQQQEGSVILQPPASGQPTTPIVAPPKPIVVAPIVEPTDGTAVPIEQMPAESVVREDDPDGSARIFRLFIYFDRTFRVWTKKFAWKEYDKTGRMTAADFGNMTCLRAWRMDDGRLVMNFHTDKAATFDPPAPPVHIDGAIVLNEYGRLTLTTSGIGKVFFDVLDGSRPSSSAADSQVCITTQEFAYSPNALECQRGLGPSDSRGGIGTHSKRAPKRTVQE